jgi:hypothetical protein
MASHSYQAYRRPARGQTVNEVGVVEIDHNSNRRLVQFKMEVHSFSDWQDAYNLAKLLAKFMTQVQLWS